MKTECVTKVWEFYLDNCAGYKEPMRKQLRELDDYVASIEADNAKLRNDADLLRAMWSQERTEKRCHMADNAKLRELVRDYERCGVHADCGLCEYDGTMSTHCPLSPCFPDADELRELGVDA